VLKLQNARLAAERVMLQEIARSLQNMNQNQMVMLGDVINNAAGMLTDESVQDSVKMLASTIKQVQPTAVEDVIQRLALLDPRTQGVVAATRAPARRQREGDRRARAGARYRP
jgi:predicted Zn-dependent peptidase